MRPLTSAREGSAASPLCASGGPRERREERMLGAGSSPGDGGDNTWHRSGHRSPKDQARAQARTRAKRVKSSGSHSCFLLQPKHSSPWAPAACTTAGLMDSLPDVFCSMPRMPFSTGTQEEAYLCWERAARFSRRGCKNRQPQTQMQSLPVANFSEAELIFPGAGGQGCKPECWGQPWIVSQGWVKVKSEVRVDHVELESSHPSLRRCCRVWADGWRVGKLPHVAIVWFSQKPRGSVDLVRSLLFQYWQPRTERKQNNSMGKRKVQSSGSRHLTGERCWMRRAQYQPSHLVMMAAHRWTPTDSSPQVYKVRG